MTTDRGESTRVVPRRRSWDLWVLVGILAVGALVRGLYLGEIASNPDFSTPGVDAGTHQYWARGLATGDWTPPPGRQDPGIPVTPYVRPPGYPHFLALIYILAGTGPVAPRIVQMGLGLVNCVLAFAIGRRWFGRAVGLTWSGFMSLYWAFIYFEGELHATVLLIPLLLSAVYLLGRWTERMAPVYAVAAGGLLGVASIVRPNALPIILVVSLWMFVVAHRRRSGRKGIVAASALILCSAASILPVTARNYLVAKDFVILSANGGINLFIGNNPAATGRPSGSIPGVGRFANCYDYPAIVSTLEHRLGTSLRYSEVSSWFYGQALDFIKSEPLAFLNLTLKKALLFWGPWEIANNKEVHYERAFSNVLSRLWGDFPAVLALAVSGGLILLVHLRKRRGELQADSETWERRREITVLLVLIVAALFLAVLPFFVCARYRVPVIAFLLLFAAYGACRAARYVAQRRWVPVAGWVLGCAVAYVVFRAPIVQGGPVRFRWHYDRGTAYERLGDYDRALEQYEQTLDIAEDVPLARLAAARLLLRNGRAADALVHLQYLSRYVHAHEADAHYLTAQAFLQQGQADQAIDRYRESLRTRPGSVPVRMELARLLSDLGKTEQAVKQYELLLMIEPNNVDALLRLGLALRDVGRAEEANKRLCEAVHLEPRCRAGLEALGIELDAAAPASPVRPAATPEGQSADELVARADRLAVVGRTAEAIELYRKALSAAPNRPLIHCKLAESLVVAGQLDQAVTHYRLATEAGPEFVTAHIGLGMTYGRLNDAESAVRHYRAAVRIDPENVAAHYNLGIALGDGLGRYTEAVDVLNKALNLADATKRADLADRISERIERFRGRLPKQPGDDSE